MVQRVSVSKCSQCYSSFSVLIVLFRPTKAAYMNVSVKQYMSSCICHHFLSFSTPHFKYSSDVGLTANWGETLPNLCRAQLFVAQNAFIVLLRLQAKAGTFPIVRDISETCATVQSVYNLDVWTKCCIRFGVPTRKTQERRKENQSALSHWIFLSSGTYRLLVSWKAVDVSEEHVASICRLEE
jgi:hypothetical protein